MANREEIPNLSDSEEEEDDSDENNPLLSPKLANIHGFGPAPFFEVKEAHVTVEGDLNEETKASGDSSKQPGRPKGRNRPWEYELLKDQSTPENDNSLPSTSHLPTPLRKRIDLTLPKVDDPTSTSTRISFFLVGKPHLSLQVSKLPKAGPVLGRFLLHLEDKSILESSRAMVEEVKAVWLHHFGPQLILGKVLGMTDKEQESKKIIVMDNRI